MGNDGGTVAGYGFLWTHDPMVGVLLLVVWCVVEMMLAPRLIEAYENWRGRRALNSHASYLGVLVGWSHHEHGAFSITLANVSVARAHTIGIRATGMALEELERTTVEVPYVADIDSWCRRWVVSGARVRVELVQREAQILFFSILDTTGAGISRLRPEFLQWGHET
jgi:hypothetical protein